MSKLSPMKKLIFILGILSILIISGCKESDSQKITEECKEFAESLMPDKIVLYDESIPGPDTYCWLYVGDLRPNKWKNEAEISDGICVKRGSEEGQSVNLFYSGHWGKDSISYSEKIVAPDGTIKGDNSFIIKINVVKPIEGSERKGYSGGREYYNEIKDFEILNHEIVSCNLVED